MSRLPRHAWLDLAAVLALTALALAGFADTFPGVRWLVVGLTGAGFGLAWALLLVRLRLGVWVALATLAVPYVYTAGGIALGDYGLFLGIPDLDTFSAVLHGSTDAWGLLLESAPPVDPRGPVLLVPYALGLFPAGAAASVALLTRRSWPPVLPLLAGLMAVLLLGSITPVAVLGQGLGFGAVSVLWLSHRALRVDADPRGGAVPLGRVAAAAVVVAVAAAVVVPLGGADADRVQLRESVAPYDSTYFTTPLTDFRRFRPDPTDPDLARKPLFQVFGLPPGDRVRVATLDSYDGTRWLADPDRDAERYDDRFLLLSDDVDAGVGERRITVALRRWYLRWAPMVGDVQAIRADGEVRYNAATGTALTPDGLADGAQYLVRYRPLPERLRRSMQPWPERDEDLFARAEFLDTAARAWSAGAPTPIRAVLRAAAELRERGRYSDGAVGWETRFVAGHDESRLGNGFVLDDQTVGNDEQYAATMALLANRIGVPARVVVGAEVPRTGVVRGRDLHAWVELRVADGSWRVLPTEAFMGHRPPGRREPPAPPITVPAGSPPVPAQQSPPQTVPQSPRPAPDPAADEPWPWWLLWLLPPLGVAAVPAAKWWRRRRRRTTGPASARYAGGWDELVDAAHDLGAPVPAAATRPAQARALGAPVGLALRADLAVFAADEPAADGVEGYWAGVAVERRRLRNEARPVRRVVAPVNPASLVRRPAGRRDP